MARKRAKNKSLKEKSSSAIHFALEDDAEDIFVKFLEENQIPDKDSESHQSRSQKSRKHQAQPQIEIDLHGLTVREACKIVSHKINEVKAQSLVFTVKIITGKGLHSGPSGGVLSTEVYSFVMDRYAQHIDQIEDPPHEIKLSGVPIRGHFTVKFKF